MPFNTLSPDFRESLRQLADELAAKEAAKKEAIKKVKVHVAMEEKEIKEIEDVTEEGYSTGAGNK